MQRRSLAGSNQSKSGLDTGGIRLDGLEQVSLGDHTAGDLSPTEVGRFCTKPLTLLIYLGGLKLPCIDCLEAETELASLFPERPSGRGTAGGTAKSGEGTWGGRTQLFRSCSQNQLN